MPSRMAAASVATRCSVTTLRSIESSATQMMNLPFALSSTWYASAATGWKRTPPVPP
ncbi:hypothetical protein D3C85_1844720 [compost metagenome]